MIKLTTCLSEIEIADYLDGKISDDKKKNVDGHLAECSTCIEKLAFAYEAVKEFKENKTGVLPMKSNWKKNIWLFGAIAMFILSFFVPRYFIQLLVGTILMGTKWIFDSVNARILITIYEAWKKG